MKEKKSGFSVFKPILAVVVIVVAVGAGLFLSGKSDFSKNHDDFAQCLADKGVKMYGAYWCPHCKNQKKMFGSSWKRIKYIECSLPNRGGQTAVCREAGIKSYPTWEFADGKKVAGELSLQKLSEYSGCGLGE